VDGGVPSGRHSFATSYLAGVGSLFCGLQNSFIHFSAGGVGRGCFQRSSECTVGSVGMVGG
jgi:hypothetical protein